MDLSTVPCTRCRSRRVKCDKRLPGCVRCEKSSQPCPGYNRFRKFLDEGHNLRRKFSAAAGYRRTVDQDQGSLNLDARESQSVDSGNPVPSQSSSNFIHTDERHDAAASAQTPAAAQIAAQDISDADFEAAFFDIDPQVYYAEGNNWCGFFPNDANDSQGPPTLSWANDIAVDDFSQSDFNDVGTLHPVSDPFSETEHETAYLIRYFADRISPCLDVFDVERYFGHVVPIKAVQSALLKNALAAIAAKQFGKTKREAAVANSQSYQTPSRSMLEKHCDASHVDWFYKAASFYDKAIGHMMRCLQSLRDGNSTTADSSSSSTLGLHSTVTPWPFKKRRVENDEISGNIVDDLLAAISVLLLYESLDNRGAEVSRHMSGAQYLLTIDLDQLLDMNLNVRNDLHSLDRKRAWQATFWNVACIDWIASYTEQVPPRLDLQDPHLWKAAGLPIREVNGIYLPESICNDSNVGVQMTETVACRTLIWIVLKTLMYVTTEKEGNNSQSALSQASRLRSSQPYFGLECWADTQRHLEDWCASLPDTFEPCMRLARPYNGGKMSRDPTQSLTQNPLPELFHSSSMCATAVVLYHFVQLLLLLHKPLNHGVSESHSRFVSKRLDAYRQLSIQIAAHASEICAISLGRPNEIVRLHMVQPLHLAGLCFETHEQRVVLAHLLVSIQQETGYSTACRVAGLREEWG